jgi:hypothetical protein
MQMVLVLCYLTIISKYRQYCIDRPCHLVVTCIVANINHGNVGIFCIDLDLNLTKFDLIKTIYAAYTAYLFDPNMSR